MSAHAAPAQTARTAPVLTSKDIMWIMIGIVLAMILGALDQTIVATALPTIGHDLHDFEHMSWIVTSYLVASTAVTPLYGKLADIRGRRFTLMVAITLFLIGSILCAISPTMGILIIARALQGFGGGGLMAIGQTIIGDIATPQERAKYQGYIATVFALSSIVGPLLGGFFAEHIHWSVIFWINLPIGAAALLMTTNSLKKLPRHDRPHKLDVLGSVLLMAATSVLLLALTWGGVRYSWGSIEILSLLAGAAILWGLFTLRIMTAQEPLVPIGLLSNGVVRNCTIAAFFGMGTFIGQAIYVPVFFESVLHLSPSDSGLALIPFMVGTVVGATMTGRFMVKVKRYKRITYVGMSVAILATAIMIPLIGTASLPLLLTLFCLISFSTGTLFPMTTVSVQNAVEPHQMGTATALMNFMRSLGGAFIVALYGALLLSFTGIGAGGGFESAKSVSDTANLVFAFQMIFSASCGAYILALGFFILVEERPWRGRAPAPQAVDVH